MTGPVDRLVEGRRNWLGLPTFRPGLGDTVDYLAEQVASGEVLLHGSNLRTIELFTPQEQTTYHGAMTRAVFATADPVWPLFFAVTSTERASSRWNACMSAQRPGAGARYFFSVGAADEAFWTDGAVYLLPRDAFRMSDEPSEWLASEAVAPRAVVPVTPGDFPFRARVFRHVEGEAAWRLDLRLIGESARFALRRSRRSR